MSSYTKYFLNCSCFLSKKSKQIDAILWEKLRKIKCSNEVSKDVLSILGLVVISSNDTLKVKKSNGVLLEQSWINHTWIHTWILLLNVLTFYFPSYIKLFNIVVTKVPQNTAIQRHTVAFK